SGLLTGTSYPMISRGPLKEKVNEEVNEEASGGEAMKFDPSKFYIGVVDLFSIMLPGGVLAYYLYASVGSRIFGPLFPELRGDTASWIVFIFAAYLLGHIVFLIGSYLDKFYGPIRKAFWPATEDFAYVQAREIKRRFISELDGEPINTFQWSKVVLSLQHPPGLVEVARFEADSKFFRTLVVVLTILLVSVIWHGPRDLLIPALLMLIALSFWRYVERRYKSTQQAYWYVIVLHTPRAPVEARTPIANAVTHAGGIVFRRKNEAVTYLLVTAKNAEEWVLPKGHVEEGEGPEETALREVMEETGVAARPCGRISRHFTFSAKGEIVTVAFFLMELVREGQTREKRRKDWLPIHRALERATHEETRAALKLGDDIRVQLEATSGRPAPGS